MNSHFRVSEITKHKTYLAQTCGIGYFHVFNAVKPIVFELPPWYAFLNAIIPRLPLYRRAISIANSLASVPEFTTYTTCIKNHLVQDKVLNEWWHRFIPQSICFHLYWKIYKLRTKNIETLKAIEGDKDRETKKVNPGLQITKEVLYGC